MRVVRGIRRGGGKLHLVCHIRGMGAVKARNPVYRREQGMCTAGLPPPLGIGFGRAGGRLPSLRHRSAVFEGGRLRGVLVSEKTPFEAGRGL